MKRLKRREFMTIGAAGAAGVVAGACGKPKFTAIARFSGLFGLVARPTFDDHADVLFFNPAAIPGFPKHVPVLRAHLDNVSGAAPTSTDDYDPGIGIWDVGLCHVRFDAQPAPPLTSANPSSDMCPGNDAAKWRDPRRIPSLTVALGAGNAKVNPSFVQDGDLRNSPVATRIPLKSGILGAALPRDRRVRNVKFHMVGATTPVPAQPMTDVVQLDMPDLTSLTVTIVPFDGSANRTLTVTPTGGRPVYLWLENLTDPLENPMPHHFRAVYSFLGGPPPATKPDPGNAEDCQDGAPHDFPNYCPPGTLEP